jgi:hypothetical protein
VPVISSPTITKGTGPRAWLRITAAGGSPRSCRQGAHVVSESSAIHDDVIVLQRVRLPQRGWPPSLVACTTPDWTSLSRSLITTRHITSAQSPRARASREMVQHVHHVDFATTTTSERSSCKIKKLLHRAIFVRVREQSAQIQQSSRRTTTVRLPSKVTSRKLSLKPQCCQDDRLGPRRNFFQIHAVIDMARFHMQEQHWFDFVFRKLSLDGVVVYPYVSGARQQSDDIFAARIISIADSLFRNVMTMLEDASSNAIEM